MLKQTPPRHLSAILIAAGLVLLASGLITRLNQRPNADELAALERGHEVSAQVTVSPGGSADLFLPAPGVASLPAETSVAEARPDDAGTPGVAEPLSLDELTDVKLLASTVRAETGSASASPANDAAPAAPVNGQSPTRIVIPKINLDAKVVETGWKQVMENGKPVSTWVVPDFAAGYFKTSAYPGTSGNTVLAGHHNIKGKVFRYLVNLEPGDQIDLYVNDRKLTYQVSDKFILKEAGATLAQRRKNAEWIAPTQDERLTLVTCWPYWTNTHRVIVVARPMAADGSSAQSAPAATP